MRHFKIIGAIIALLAEIVLQLSGYQNPNLAIALALIIVGLLLWSAWPMIKRIQFQKPMRLKSPQQPSNVKSSTEDSKRSDQEGFEFYSQRQPLAWFRDKIHSARIIWAAYLIGGSTNNSELLKSANFKRLVLLHPDNEAVKAIQVMESDKSLDSLQKIIRELTDFAKKKNCDVRWCRDITYSLLTIGNPPDGTDLTPPGDMWVIVEVYTPGIEAEKRPSFLVKRINNQPLADRLLASFNKLWEHSKPPD